jgi:hypothetical protein
MPDHQRLFGNFNSARTTRHLGRGRVDERQKCEHRREGCRRQISFDYRPVHGIFSFLLSISNALRFVFLHGLGFHLNECSNVGVTAFKPNSAKRRDP